jgi:hypothetical protein
MSWDIHFPNPIFTSQGKALVTLRDAATYITKLPKAEHDTPAWQTAIQVLMQAADNYGPIEFARLGMEQALHPKGAPGYRSVKKDPKWRNRCVPLRN